MIVKVKSGIVLAFMIFVLTSCGNEQSKKDTKAASPISKKVIENYATTILAAYQDSLDKANVMKTAIDAFIAEPSEATQTAAKKAWLVARIPYLQTEVGRFYAGPIDGVENGPEGLINAWPMDEGHVDYVAGNKQGLNIINNLVDYPVLSTATLKKLNTSNGEKNISVGYHAIEFLLWGQDLSADGPGARPFTDYIEGSTGTHENQGRRKQYLSICVDLLIEDLTFLVKEWSAGNPSNYRAKFLAMDEKTALLNIFTGIEKLSFGELASQRMNVALVNHDQEDEHSCFSDNTTNDILYDALGISNVILGKYVDSKSVAHGSDSFGLYELLKTVNPKMADDIKLKMNNALVVVGKIHAPFDQEISQNNTEGNARVKAGVNSLKELNDSITDATIALGLK